MTGRGREGVLITRVVQPPPPRHQTLLDIKTKFQSGHCPRLSPIMDTIITTMMMWQSWFSYTWGSKTKGQNRHNHLFSVLPWSQNHHQCHCANWMLVFAETFITQTRVPDKRRYMVHCFAEIWIVGYQKYVWYYICKNMVHSHCFTQIWIAASQKYMKVNIAEIWITSS